MGAPDEFHSDAHPDAQETTGDRKYGEWGQCIATASSTDERCKGYAKGPHGKCRNHGGDSPGAPEGNQNAVGNDGGAPEGNGNAARHNLHANRTLLYERLSDDKQTEVDRLEASFIERYIDYHAQEPDYGARKQLFRTAIEIVKEDLADEWLVEQGEETGNYLIENYVIGQDEEGNVNKAPMPNSALDKLSDLKRETRLTLKDMGLLDSPEQQQAEATGTLAAAIKDASTSD